MTFANAQEELDAWLSSMQFELEIELLAELPEDFPYDFDRGSLAVLEQLVLAEFDTKDSLRDPDQADFVDRLVRYVGETIIRNYPGSKWAPGGPSYNDLPVVLVPDGTDVPEAPFFLLTRAVARRTGNEFTRVFDGIAKNIAMNAT